VRTGGRGRGCLEEEKEKEKRARAAVGLVVVVVVRVYYRTDTESKWCLDSTLVDGSRGGKLVKLEGSTAVRVVGGLWVGCMCSTEVVRW
jgi:hypothetical protein